MYTAKKISNIVTIEIVLAFLICVVVVSFGTNRKTLEETAVFSVHIVENKKSFVQIFRLNKLYTGWSYEVNA